MEEPQPHEPLDSEPGDRPHWDAGAMGCGELVLELFFRFQALPSRGVLELTALDPGAPEDLPAWCRMSGHELIAAAHPHYSIRKGS